MYIVKCVFIYVGILNIWNINIILFENVYDFFKILVFYFDVILIILIFVKVFDVMD